MVLSYYLRKCPYSFVWHVLRLFGRNPTLVVYCSAPLDYVVLSPIAKYLPPVPWVAKDRRTATYLRQRGLRPRRTPSFPRAVIMCRHAAHRFPIGRIVKIGFRHGAYHFKSFAKARYYNAFDVYFVTSQREAEEATAAGVTVARAVGFPKLDPAFDGTYDDAKLRQLRREAGLDPEKKVVLFSATWDKSGMSAIHKWIDLVEPLAERYNVLITVHPWTSGRYVARLRRMTAVHFVEDPNVIPFLLLADVLVGDTSSIIAEFCALDKPIVTFRVPETGRTVPRIVEMLDQISLRIEDPGDLERAIEESLSAPAVRGEQRRRVAEAMLGSLDGQAGRRAARAITELVPRLDHHG
jgi:CDP-glycerol glycerophosphotransferase (TagB/SpsB family)